MNSITNVFFPFFGNLDIGTILSQVGDFKELSSEEYTIRRILNGIPEGIEDMWPEQSLPLESNFDYMNGGKAKIPGEIFCLRNIKKNVYIRFYINALNSNLLFFFLTKIVDFRKGCYVGQELTIRTYHTGVVRKRILPVQLYEKDERYLKKEKCKK